jgi:hypothetical protein
MERVVSPPPVSKPRFSCLLANDDAEEVKQTTIAFRSVLSDVRVEAVYSVGEALDWVSRESWPIILFAERLAITEGLNEILQNVRARAPYAAIVVQGEQDVPPRFMLIENSPADYYWTQRLGHTGGELPLLALQLVEKRQLRRQLDAHDRLSKQTENVLSDMTSLMRSMTTYYEVERLAHGINRDTSVGDKAVTAEQILTELVTMLAQRRRDHGQ